MARQVLSQHIKAELAVIEEKKQEREEHNPNGRIIASKKSLKFYLTAKYLQRDILCSNRFLKCQVSIKKINPLSSQQHCASLQPRQTQILGRKQ